MRMELTRYAELEKAKKERWPLIISVGTMEYHGPHCALGCDTLIVNGLLEILEKERDIVIAPPMWYGVSSYAVAGPGKNTINVDADTFENNVYCVLKSLLYGGWKNIYLIVHHQSEDETANPMTLSCMKAGKKLTFEYMEDTLGRGWWGSNDNKDFYSSLAAGDKDNPWNWITVLTAMSTAAQHATGFDHAGKYESSMLMALYPQTVDLSKVSDSDEWFLQNAAEASTEIGSKMVELSMKDLRERIK